MQDTASGKLLLGNRLPTDTFDCGHIQFYKPSTHWPAHNARRSGCPLSPVSLQCNDDSCINTKTTNTSCAHPL